MILPKGSFYSSQEGGLPWNNSLFDNFLLHPFSDFKTWMRSTNSLIKAFTFYSVAFYLSLLSSEKAMAPHSSVLAWKIPWTEEPGRLHSMGSLRVGHDWATSLSLSCIGEGNGKPLQCSCLENPRDGGAWWAAVYGVAQSRKWLSSSSKLRISVLDYIISVEAILDEATHSSFNNPQTRGLRIYPTCKLIS